MPPAISRPPPHYSSAPRALLAAGRRSLPAPVPVTVSCRVEDAAAPQLDPAPSRPVCYAARSGELVLRSILLCDPPAGCTVQLCGERDRMAAPLPDRASLTSSGQHAGCLWCSSCADRDQASGLRPVCPPALLGLLPALASPCYV